MSEASDRMHVLDQVLDEFRNNMDEAKRDNLGTLAFENDCHIATVELLAVIAQTLERIGDKLEDMINQGIAS